MMHDPQRMTPTNTILTKCLFSIRPLRTFHPFTEPILLLFGWISRCRPSGRERAVGDTMMSEKWVPSRSHVFIRCPTSSNSRTLASCQTTRFFHTSTPLLNRARACPGPRCLVQSTHLFLMNHSSASRTSRHDIFFSIRSCP
jgi:hypothetical protein